MENQTHENGSGQQSINIQVPSADNIASRRPLIPALFAIVIVFFFFNFFTISCGGQKIASVTGFNMVTGTQLNDKDMFTGNQKKGEKIPSNLWAVLAFGAAIIGLGAFLIKEKREAVIGTGAGVVGFGSLVILQFAVKAAIEKKAEGAIQTDFQFAYWGALLAIGMAGFISYLRMQKTTPLTITVTPPASSNEINTENGSQGTQNPIQNNSNFDSGEWVSKNSKTSAAWIKNNKKIAIGIGLGIVTLLIVYNVFLKHDPVRDAKRAASAMCDCSIQYAEDIIKVNEDFVKSFQSFGFTKRQDARNKYQELQNKVNEQSVTCSNEAQLKYEKARNRYIAEQELITKFDFAFNNLRSTCNTTDQGKLTSSYAEVEKMITTIKDPEPDIEKIKTDLIGQHILGWNFDALAEFKEAKISNIFKGNERIEFQLDMKLEGINQQSKHDAQVMVVYIQTNDGWVFNNVNTVFITYSYEVPSDNWINITPVQNCRWNVADDQKLLWKTDSWGSEIKSGPDALNASLPSSSSYLLKSREGRPITVTFTYRPLS